jgi:hypothetical protein
MTTTYESDLPQDMPEDAYPGVAAGRIFEFLRQKAEEKSESEQTVANDEIPDSTEDPDLPAA